MFSWIDSQLGTLLGWLRELWDSLSGLETSKAILISTTFAAVFSYWAIRTQKSIARRRATIDMLMRNLWDKDYIAARDIFNQLIDDQDRLRRLKEKVEERKHLMRSGEWNDRLTDEERRDYENCCTELHHIRSVLNNYELICIGIREGIYDEAIYRRWYYGSFMTDWKKIRPFVERVRQESENPNPENIYRELQNLAERWKVEGPWGRRELHIPLWGGRQIVIRRWR